MCQPKDTGWMTGIIKSLQYAAYLRLTSVLKTHRLKVRGEKKYFMQDFKTNAIPKKRLIIMYNDKGNNTRRQYYTY